MMLRNWGLGRLVASWLVYWVVLLAIGLGPKAWQIYQLQRRGAHGTVSFTWSGTTLEMVLLFAGPPLVATLLWLATRPRRR
ncbi:MAG: hypothetical protein ABR499_21615 [Gemmatimonadaceae bacterium]